MKIRPWILFIIFFLVLITIITLSLITQKTPSTKDTFKKSINDFQPALSFSEGVALDGEVCKGYKFETVKTPAFKPGIASLSKRLLSALGTNNITTDNPFHCLDSDTINAIKLTRKCDRKVEGFNPANSSSCKGKDGKLYKYNESEVYYDTCGTDSSDPTKPFYCAGSVAYISAGFHSQSDVAFPCLTKTNDDFVFPISTCDPSDTKSQFRLVLTNTDTFPVSSDKPNIGISGSIGAIFDRQTGLCLMAQGTDENELGTVELQDPKLAANNGFAWLMLAPFIADEAAGYSPQQIIYVGDIVDFNATLALSQLTTDRLIVTLNQYGSKSLVNAQGKARLLPYAKDGFPCNNCSIVDTKNGVSTNGCGPICAKYPSTVDSKGYNAQYVTLPLYKELSNPGFLPFK